MIPPCRAGYLLWTVLCTVCSSNTPASYLRMADLHKSHLPHWNNPSRAIEACESTACSSLNCQDCNLFCSGGRVAIHLLGGWHRCLWWLIWQGVLLQLASFPIFPGADCVLFMAYPLSDALGSAQGCSWTLKRVDSLQCKACIKPLRHLFLQQVWQIICLTESRMKNPPLFPSSTTIVITIINIR